MRKKFHPLEFTPPQTSNGWNLKSEICDPGFQPLEKIAA